jgi:hypothetical protein
MSQENVDVVRRIYEAFARDDLTALLESLDPAIECYDRPSRPGADVYIGRTGFMRFWQSDREVFESVLYNPREDIVNVWKVRCGKAVELRIYSTEREALEAVGLRE